MIKRIFSKRGEGYVDIVVSVLAVCMLMVISLNVFSFLKIKQDLDYMANEMVISASTAGKTIQDPDLRYQDLKAETGLAPSYSWEAEYFNNMIRSVQYGKPMTLTLTYRTELKGIGISIPITMTVQKSGTSKVYWKGAG